MSSVMETSSLRAVDSKATTRCKLLILVLLLILLVLHLLLAQEFPLGVELGLELLLPLFEDDLEHDLGLVALAGRLLLGREELPVGVLLRERILDLGWQVGLLHRFLRRVELGVRRERDFPLLGSFFH